MFSRDWRGRRGLAYAMGRQRPARGVTGPTFRLDTRSAVSNSVNWLIWSTIPEILGFTAAASVELCLRAILCWMELEVVDLT